MKKNIMLIGSMAAKIHFPDFPREPHDTDYISEDEIDKADCHYCESFDYIIKKYPDLKVATPEILYALKVSHSFWDVHWDKTIFDILFYQSKNIQLDEELYIPLYKDCEKRYGKKKANLNKDNEKFFADSVERVYVHDDIHKAIAYYDKPLYFKIKDDTKLANVSHNRFLELSEEDKIKLCREEIFVTALERFLIPNNFKKHSFAAFKDAMKLLVTSMTKGWFPKFIVMNWLKIREVNSDYVSKFKKSLEKGEINVVTRRD